MKFRALLLMVVLLASFMVAGLTSAQDIDLCFGLSAEDCAVINAASANGVGEATSFTQNQSITFTMSGIPDGDTGGTIDITFSQVGAIDITMGGGTLIPFTMSGSYTISGSGPLDTLPDTPIAFRIVEDIIYFQNPENAEQWLSIDLAELLNDPTISGALGGDAGAATDALPVEVPDVDSLLGLLDIVNLPGLITYERAANTFVFTVDLTALSGLLEEGNEDLLDTVVETASEVDPSAGLFITLIPALIDTGTIQVIQVVNPDLNIIETLEFNADFSIAFGTLAGDPSAAPIAGSLAVSATTGNFNGVAPIAAPANAEPFPVDAFLEGFMQGFGAGLGGE